MFNSKLKLQGLTLEEIIHEGVHGNSPKVTIDDWLYIEHLYHEDVGDRLRREYYKGWQDGNDQAWNMIYGDEED